MNITLDRSSATNASLKIAIQPDDYKAQVDKKIKEYTKKAAIKGFRPGKVPPTLIQKLYGKGILVDEINTILGKAINEYIRENDLPVVGDPLPNDEQATTIDWDTQKDFEFVYDLGLASEFKVDFESLPVVTSYEIKAGEAEINQTIEDLLVRFGDQVEVEEVAEGDMVYGTFRQTESGYEDKSAIPTKQLSEAGLAAFVGAKKADTVSFDIQGLFKEQRSLELATSKKADEVGELQGTFSFEIESITRQQDATLNQELFDKVLGEGKATTEAEFRDQVAEIIQDNYRRESEYLLTDDLFKMLLDNVAIELPTDFLKRWLKLSDNNLTEEQIEKDYDSFARDLRWTLIKNQLADVAQFKVANEEIEAAAEAYVRSQFRNMGSFEGMEDIVKRVAQNYLREKDGNNYREMFNRVFANKVMEYVRSQARVEAKAIDVEAFKLLAASQAEA
jgi:trigger factor